MFDDVDDDDLYDEDDDAEAEPDEAPEAEAEVEPPKPKKKAAAKPKPVADEPAAEPTLEERQLAEFGLNALKASFVEAAKAEGFVAADFDGIGLKGIDDASKAAFVAEAKQSHEAKVAALAAQGFVYNPQAAGDAGKAAQLDAQEAEQKQAWGATGPGMVATGDEKFDNQVRDEVESGDVVGVIGSLLGQGGLGEFFVKGKRSA